MRGGPLAERQPDVPSGIACSELALLGKPVEGSKRVDDGADPRSREMLSAQRVYQLLHFTRIYRVERAPEHLRRQPIERFQVFDGARAIAPPPTC